MKATHDIASYIPQRPPFIFIDTIDAVNETMARTRYTITQDNPLVTENILPLAGLIENIAQTCAVRMGHMAGNKIGYIGAIKTIETRLLPCVGQTIVTEVRVVQEVMNICMMECTTYLGDEEIASATLKLATIE